MNAQWFSHYSHWLRSYLDINVCHSRWSLAPRNWDKHLSKTKRHNRSSWRLGSSFDCPKLKKQNTFECRFVFIAPVVYWTVGRFHIRSVVGVKLGVTSETFNRVFWIGSVVIHLTPLAWRSNNRGQRPSLSLRPHDNLLDFVVFVARIPSTSVPALWARSRGDEDNIPLFFLAVPLAHLSHNLSIGFTITVSELKLSKQTGS